MNSDLIELAKYIQDKYFENKIYEYKNFESLIFEILNGYHIELSFINTPDNISYNILNFKRPMININIWYDEEENKKFNIFIITKYTNENNAEKINKRGTKKEIKNEIDSIIGKLLMHLNV